jgi:hypothetical protein
LRPVDGAIVDSRSNTPPNNINSQFFQRTTMRLASGQHVYRSLNAMGKRHMSPRLEERRITSDRKKGGGSVLNHVPTWFRGVCWRMFSRSGLDRDIFVLLGKMVAPSLRVAFAGGYILYKKI